MPGHSAKRGGVNINNLTIDESGVRINGHHIDECESITVKNIDFFGPMKVELIFNVDKVNITHQTGRLIKNSCS